MLAKQGKYPDDADVLRILTREPFNMNYDWLLSKSRWLWAFFLYAETKNGGIQISFKIPHGMDPDEKAANADILREFSGKERKK